MSNHLSAKQVLQSVESICKDCSHLDYCLKAGEVCAAFNELHDVLTWLNKNKMKYPQVKQN